MIFLPNNAAVLSSSLNNRDIKKAIDRLRNHKHNKDIKAKDEV